MAQCRIAPAAERDIESILIWSFDHFGRQVCARYQTLLTQALLDVANDPELPGSIGRSEIAARVRTYHLFHSRKRAAPLKKPRHFLLYRSCEDGSVEIGRVLHESMDLERHLPDEYRRE